MDVNPNASSPSTRFDLRFAHSISIDISDKTPSIYFVNFPLVSILLFRGIPLPSFLFRGFLQCSNFFLGCVWPPWQSSSPNRHKRNSADARCWQSRWRSGKSKWSSRQMQMYENPILSDCLQKGGFSYLSVIASSSSHCIGIIAFDESAQDSLRPKWLKQHRILA